MGLSAYTMIATADGSEKRAEDVSPGDCLIEAGSGGTAVVKKSLQGPGVGMIGIVLENGDVLHATGDQCVAAAGGPVRAADLPPGMSVPTRTGSARCAEAAPLMGDYMVYDIVVESASASPRLWAGGMMVAVARAH